MRFHLSLIILVLSAYSLARTTASAQEKTVNHTPPVPLIKTEAGRAAYQTLRVEYLRIQTTQLKKKKKDKGVEAQLLSVLEELAMYACSTIALGDWAFEVKNAPDDCEQYLGKLTELETPSPVPACIRSGKDSQACAQMFSSQQTMSIYDFTTRSGDQFRVEDLGSGFLSSVPPLLNQKINDIQFQLSTTEDSEKTVSLKSELLRNQRRSLALSCTEQPLVFYKPLSEIGIHKESFQDREDPDTERIKTLIQSYRKEISKEQKALKEQTTSIFGSQFDPPAPTPSPDTPSTQELVRVRLVSADCMRAIDSVLTLMPLSALAICKRDGFFGPTCSQARRNRSSQDIMGDKSESTNANEGRKELQYSTF